MYLQIYTEIVKISDSGATFVTRTKASVSIRVAYLKVYKHIYLF